MINEAEMWKLVADASVTSPSLPAVVKSVQH
jgi:hypothetical protein